ncbi:hypothetical protein GCM10027057_07530 [Marisediminicola antarctica]|uniref:Uncharacterized protein n=1 Tax=Marisediminicola antarctica TaxID=674079 RepID=A0A7L5AKA7_9MICO|nr:hypothetical protein BHD05_15155 [Marisediminicola antarctica]
MQNPKHTLCEYRITQAQTCRDINQEAFALRSITNASLHVWTLKKTPNGLPADVDSFTPSVTLHSDASAHIESQ